LTPCSRTNTAIRLTGRAVKKLELPGTEPAKRRTPSPSKAPANLNTGYLVKDARPETQGQLYQVPYRYRCGRSPKRLIMSTPAKNPPTCAQKATPPELWCVSTIAVVVPLTKFTTNQ